MAVFLGNLRGSHITFYGLALEIMQYHFHWILFVKAVTSHIQLQGENRTSSERATRFYKYMWD